MLESSVLLGEQQTQIKPQRLAKLKQMAGRRGNLSDQADKRTRHVNSTRSGVIGSNRLMDGVDRVRVEIRTRLISHTQQQCHSDDS
jgi:hypothetical protein